ncbi:MAG: FHA domain-containing protein [Nocardioides sp.]
MSIDLSVEADLEFSVDIPGQRTLTGALTGSGKTLELSVSHPFLFAGRSDAGAIRGVAEGLARQGLTVTVTSPAGPLVTLGGRRTPWWQRPLTGSRHIRIARGAGLWSLVRGRTQAPSGGALPTAELAPPATMWPIAPTFRRRWRMPVTTTHAEPGAGSPRLILAPSPHPLPGEAQQVLPLRVGVTTIGSDPGCDIVLAGLEPVHAEVRHDEEDEFVLVARSDAAPVRVNGELVTGALLRTASRIRLGEWTMSYYREEYADHGRPYGGRLGGEIGHQRPQPPRHRADPATLREQL